MFEWIKVGRCDLNYRRSSCVFARVGGWVCSFPSVRVCWRSVAVAWQCFVSGLGASL